MTLCPATTEATTPPRGGQAKTQHQNERNPSKQQPQNERDPSKQQNLTASPLPVLDSLQLQELGLRERPEAIGVYHMILQAEERALYRGANENLISARVLGYLLLELHAQCRGALGDEPCSAIINEVLLTPQDSEHDAVGVIFELGRKYRDQLVYAFWNPRRLYPHEHSSPSRPSYDTLENMVAVYMEASGEDHETVRNKALVRDNFQCMVTGLVDYLSIQDNAYLLREMERLDKVPAPLATTRILSNPTTQGPRPDVAPTVASETHCPAGVLTILRQFGLEDLAHSLEQTGGLDQVWNVLSLESNMHIYFNHFDVWFEGTGKPHCYRVCLSDALSGRLIYKLSQRPETSSPNASMVIDLSSNLQGLPHPDPRILALHATCARVGHLSGAADLFDTLEEDREDSEDSEDSEE